MADSGAVIAELLAAGGVRRMYTVPGESFLQIIDGVDRHPELSLVSVRHEGAGSFMAEADARLTGRPAVVAGTRAVGAANLAIGVHTAHQSSTPMIVLLGQVDSGFLGREAFQEVDLPAFLGPISKQARTVTRADRIPEMVADALRVATAGRPGPVVLAFPADVLRDDVPQAGFSRALRELALDRRGPAPDPAAIAELAGRLRRAERPVIIAGGGVRAAREELRQVAERFGAGVYVSFRRQDLFDNSHPQFLGHLGLGIEPSCLESLGRADLVLVTGSRLSEIDTAGYTLPAAASEVCHIDADPLVIGAVVPTGLGIVSDPGLALSALLRCPDGPGTAHHDWDPAHQAWLDAAAVPASRARQGCDPAQVIAAISEVFGKDTIVTNDAGNFSGFLHRHYAFTQPGTQLGPTNGAMGYGVPAAIAASLAAPGRTVLALAGDGGFLMSGQEIETAVRYGLKIVVVVFRNGLHGTIAMHQARTTERLSGVSIGPVDAAGFARSLGAHSMTVSTEQELRPALRAALADPVTCVVDVTVDPRLVHPDVELTGV